MVDARTLGQPPQEPEPTKPDHQDRGVATTSGGGVNSGGKHALTQELAAIHAASFGWALSCCGRDRAVAEDVLQDAYFKVLDGRARFEGRSNVKTWLFGVIRMTAREHRRFSIVRLLGGGSGATSANREEPHRAMWAATASELNKADSRRGPDSEVAARQRAEQLAKALTKLAERQREVLHLVFYEDLSIAEAAQIMGVTLGTARQHYERGKAALVKLLDPTLSTTRGERGTQA